MKIQLSALAHSVAKVAPLLGSALAGPQGAAVGQLIAAKFGGQWEDTAALQALIQNDPEAQIKLKQIEMDHEVELQRLTLQAATQQLQDTLADRANARQREVTTASIPAAQRDRTPARLAYVLTVGLLVLALALLFVHLPGESAPVVWGLVSSLSTVWVGAMGYYHGSSLSARRESAWVHHLHYAVGSPEDDALPPFPLVPAPPGLEAD